MEACSFRVGPWLPCLSVRLDWEKGSRGREQHFLSQWVGAYRMPRVVWMRVVMPTQVKMVPISWLTMC